MFIRYFGAALASVAAPAIAQTMPMNMPGMEMTAHPKKVPPKPVKKSSRKKAAAHAVSKAPAKKPQAVTVAPGPEHAEPASADPMRGMAPMPSEPSRSAGMSMPMEQQQAAPMAGMPMAGMQHAGYEMAMKAALGPYTEQRESSGTAWQPDSSSSMGGAMAMSGDWMLMAHGTANLVYDHQSGPRGDSKAFVSGMLMGMAQHPLGNGAVQFRAMLSPEPLMGPRGYPLLLASGETANGRERLIDRQHPHDLFMELSGSISQDLGSDSSLFVYGGLPGEPAFGPPAFMHREAIMDSPEAPITHHWLDSTHISFGVLTAGLVVGRLKLDASRFNAREPDQHRWNIETGPLDSTAVRLSWNPTRTLSLQGSWGHFTDPEQLEPGVDQNRLSASALYADEIAPGWKLAGTLAWGRKTAAGHSDDAFAVEAALKHAAWTVFGRGEATQNRELIEVAANGPAYRVGKVSLGAVRDFALASHVSVGAGALFALNFVPSALSPVYGSSEPKGWMTFLRLKLN